MVVLPQLLFFLRYLKLRKHPKRSKRPNVPNISDPSGLAESTSASPLSIQVVGVPVGAGPVDGVGDVVVADGTGVSGGVPSDVEPSADPVGAVPQVGSGGAIPPAVSGGTISIGNLLGMRRSESKFFAYEGYVCYTHL